MGRAKKKPDDVIRSTEGRLICEALSVNQIQVLLKVWHRQKDEFFVVQLCVTEKWIMVLSYRDQA